MRALETSDRRQRDGFRAEVRGHARGVQAFAARADANIIGRDAMRLMKREGRNAKRAFDAGIGREGKKHGRKRKPANLDKLLRASVENWSGKMAKNKYQSFVDELGSQPRFPT